MYFHMKKLIAEYDKQLARCTGTYDQFYLIVGLYVFHN